MMNKRHFTTPVPPVGKKQTLLSGGLILGCILTLLMLTGCAHRAQQVAPVKSDSVVSEPKTPTFTSTDDVSTTIVSVVGAIATDETEAGDFDESFADDFEESFEEEQVTVADPLEPVNRAIFAFNDGLYFWVLKPVTKVFKAVVPEEIRSSTNNAFVNIRAPIRIASSLLQGKFKRAGTEFGRFFINSTVGVLGFGNPAADFPVFEHDREDLGQTLAVWGIKDGIYLVLPFFGPSTLRDAVGRVGDAYLHPLVYGLDGAAEILGVKAYETINELSFSLGQYEAVREGSLDPYVFMKNAYLQIRQDKISK